MKELFFFVHLFFSYCYNFQAFIFRFNPGTGFAFNMFTAVTMRAGDKTFFGEKEKIK
jgi:hypothetical protein